MNNYDFIIVGGGAAGLMMAYRMSKDTFFDDKRILIIDKEKKNINDRTWCFWENSSGEWDDILVTSWKKIQFKSAIYSTETSILPYKYKMIRSMDFYKKIWNQLASCTTISFLESDVLGVYQVDNTAKVVTTTDTFYSNCVLNSILFSDDYINQTEYPLLQQHFVGHFIKTEKELFSEEVATFMDFTVAQNGNTRFMYMLPFNKNEALVEYTLFSKDLLDFKEYEHEIEKYLQDKNILNYTITEKEQGSIPMTCYPFWNKNSKNIVHIGTAGGWSKASTGFTFKNINKKTATLLDHLKTNKPLHKFHQTNRFWLYDLLLLDILSEKNALGATIFGQLFKRTKPAKILKFLDEETLFIEELILMIKMPPANFIRAIFKRIF